MVNIPNGAHAYGLLLDPMLIFLAKGLNYASMYFFHSFLVSDFLSLHDTKT